MRDYLLEYPVRPKIKVPIALMKPMREDYGQSFGQDFSWNGLDSFYGQWGLDGHNGIDFPAPTNSNIYAPCDLWVDNYLENETYGNNLWAYSKEWKDKGDVYRLEMVFSHLEDTVITKQQVTRGTLIAKSGNSGYPVTSTGPHLHWGVRLQRKIGGKWQVFDADNGYRGYFNQYLIIQDMFKLIKEADSNDVYAVDELAKRRHKVCNVATLKQGHLTKLWDMEDIEEVSTVKNYKAGVEMMFTYLD